MLYHKDKFTVSKANLAVDWSTLEIVAPNNAHMSSVKAVWFKKKDGEWNIFGGFIGEWSIFGGSIGSMLSHGTAHFMQGEQHFLVEHVRWDGTNIKAATTNLATMIASVQELEPLLAQFKSNQRLSANYDRWYGLKP